MRHIKYSGFYGAFKLRLDSLGSGLPGWFLHFPPSISPPLKHSQITTRKFPALIYPLLGFKGCLGRGPWRGTSRNDGHGGAAGGGWIGLAGDMGAVPEKRDETFDKEGKERTRGINVPLFNLLYETMVTYTRAIANVAVVTRPWYWNLRRSRRSGQECYRERREKEGGSMGTLMRRIGYLNARPRDSSFFRAKCHLYF